MYTLDSGCISKGNRPASRDSERRQFETLEAAEGRIQQARENLASAGYKIEYAIVRGAEGKIVVNTW